MLRGVSRWSLLLPVAWPLGLPTISHYPRLERATPRRFGSSCPFRFIFILRLLVLETNDEERPPRFSVWYIYECLPWKQTFRVQWTRPKFHRSVRNPSRLHIVSEGLFFSVFFLFFFYETRREVVREILLETGCPFAEYAVESRFLIAQKHRRRLRLVLFSVSLRYAFDWARIGGRRTSTDVKRHRLPICISFYAENVIKRFVIGI